MSDYLVNASENATLKSILKTIGIPVPQKLKRAEGAWKEKSLEGKAILTGYANGSLLQQILPAIYQKTGAGAEMNSDKGYAGLVFDATGIKTIADLESLYQFYHESVRKIATCGRVVIITQEPKDNAGTEEAAAFRAIEGFMRSLAKEIGKRGATANIVQLGSSVPASSFEKMLLAALHFILSERSAYVDAQVIKLSGEVNFSGEIPLAKPLAGKTALVTGAARGIGEATARTLAREGAKVLIVDVPALKDVAEKVTQEIQGELLLTDITGSDAPGNIRDFIMKTMGGLDILVHNAGITRDKTLANMDLQKWQSVLNVNLQSILNLNKELVPHTLKENGRMICVSSISGFSGNFGQTNYAATKAGIIGYVAALSKELKSKNITVNGVAPGFIESDMTAKMPFMTLEFARRLSNLSQGGIPHDIAEVIAFLSSPGAASITGQTIRICGGSLIGA